MAYMYGVRRGSSSLFHLDQPGQLLHAGAMNPVKIDDAKTHLSELVQHAEPGEEIVIARNGKPTARLVPLAAPAASRPGGWEGRVWMTPDLDESDATIAALMLHSDPPE